MPSQPESSARYSGEYRWLMAVSTLILALTIVPVIWLYSTSGPEQHYSGFIYAWDDGSSYLATMREGARGAWLYTLPYSADPGQSFFLFSHYLFLGHIAGWLRVEPIIIFHVARLLGGLTLLVILYKFISRFFAGLAERRFAFLVATLGSGLGWLAIFAGHPTPDLWQAEAFPFLAILANVHFPWAMAAFLLVLDALTRQETTASATDWLLVIGATILLALIQPYAMVILGIVSVIWMLLIGWRSQTLARAAIVRLVVVGAISGAFALYYVYMTVSVPSYAAWEKQDVTLSPGAFDYVIAGGLPLLLVLVRGMQIVRKREAFDVRNDALLWLWIVISVVLMYVPLSHQRRFAFGLYIPVSIIAVQAITGTTSLAPGGRRALLVGAMCLTNALLMVGTLVSAASFPSYLFFARSEWNALMYLRNSAPPDQVVLASPEMGLFIPAWTDQRVVYGHPNETLNATIHRQEVEAYFAGKLAAPSDVLASVDYIFLGPREKKLGSPPIPSGFTTAFSDANVTILARQR